MIVGVGRMGEALANIIAPTRHREIALWDTDTTKVAPTTSPQALASTADTIFLCLPATAVRSFITSVRASLRPGVIVVSLVKGLDPTTGHTMHELLRDLLPARTRLVLLGGPMLSGELMQGKRAFGLAACDTATYQKLAELFAPTLLTVYPTRDARGVSAVGVLKNVYALGLGIAQALQLGDNAHGWLTAQAMREMTGLLKKLGGKPATVFSLAGLGDFAATGMSKHSRNYTVGVELVVRGKATVPSEGLLSLAPLVTRIAPARGHFPLLDAIVAVAVKHRPARQEFAWLMDKK